MTTPVANTMKVIDQGLEVPGFIMYALSQKIADDTSWNFPIADRWLAVSGRFILQGERWSIIVIEISVSNWPDQARWEFLIQNLLADATDSGAIVAWIDDEGSPFAAPPDLFMPEWMSGAVLTWRTRDGKHGPPVVLSQPRRPATPAELAHLRDFARGFADAP